MLLSLEEVLEEFAQPSLKKLQDLPASPIAKFALPRSFLKQVWKDAFRVQWKKAQAALRHGKHVILTFHLCYYNHRTREYLTPANFQTLRDAFGRHRPTFITLIDDIYDCCRRLCASEGMFPLPQDGEEALLDAFTVLDWRSMEMLLADAVALTCGSKHYLIGVKHPVSTLEELLFSNKKVAYLSHPISEPRRMWTDARVDKSHVHKIVDEIQSFSERLSQKYIVIQPTTIDEFRFRYLSAQLGDRWPFQDQGTEELLYHPPGALKNDQLFPAGWNQDLRDQAQDSPVLKRLKAAIFEQIGARDHYLVDQADIVVAYRPLYRGNDSSGVQEELLHHAILRDSEPRRQTAIVYSPEQDRKAYPARQLWETVIPGWRDAEILTGGNADLDSLIRDLQTGTPAERDAVLKGESGALKALLHRYGISIAPTIKWKGAMGRSAQLRSLSQADFLAAQVAQFQQNYLDELAKRHSARVYATIRRFEEALGLRSTGGKA
ncbi:MAG: hypothetical protein LAP87_02595 [Acidobacteriia bacterium]|nr:hypothetical protein [Terriglobia bacterium]